MSPKLSKAQRDVLAAIGKGAILHQAIPPGRRLYGSGKFILSSQRHAVRASTMTALSPEYLEKYVIRHAAYYRLTPTGRAALAAKGAL